MTPPLTTNRPRVLREESEDNARRLSSSIVLQARLKSRESVRSGCGDEGDKALEDGLKALQNQNDGSSNYWQLGQAEIKLDQGKRGEARDLLTHLHTASRTQGPNPLKRKKTDSPVDADVQYEEMERMSDFDSKFAKDRLDALLRADAWDNAKTVAHKLLKIEPSYFNIKTDMDRFAKCRQLLNLGLLCEHDESRSATLFEQQEYKAKALRIYNHGCYVIEFFHTHLDDPSAMIFGHDHVDCANLFFSAARMCIYFDHNGFFDELGNKLLPRGFTEKFKTHAFRCSPPLEEADWCQQALWFIEQGRSRALLESIIRGGEEIVPRPKKVLLAHVVDVVRAQSLLDRRISTSPSANAGSIIRDSPGCQTSPAYELPNNQSLPPLITSFEPERSPSSNTPAEFPLCPSEKMDTAGEIEAERRRIVRLKWKKWSQHILLYTFAKENPTLNAALQARNRKLDIPRMIKNIPNGTAMIEYSFVSAVPPGLIFLVITNVGIQQALWTNCDLKRIQRHILDLRQCMWSPHENVRDNSTSQLESGSTGPRTATEQLQKALYTDLVAPIERRLSSLSRLIIIPSGDLAHVPWTMFFNIPFTVVPSLSIWDRLHASTNDISKASSKISVVSNSPYDEAGFLRDIPYSRMEAFYVADIHDHQKPFLADKHNRPEFQQQAETAHILHLCAHSSFNDKDPMGSSIQLFKNSLTIKGWHELKIRPELVIFSSCLSGISKAFDSGSTFGFAHTLLATGTRAFIGSLWPVDDAATLILMMLFYKELRKSLSPSEALYSAQRQMREMDQDGLFELTSELKALFPPGGDGHQDYVFPAKHYLRVLQELSVEGLKKPRCWAAFVLTGYGCKPLY